MKSQLNYLYSGSLFSDYYGMVKLGVFSCYTNNWKPNTSNLVGGRAVSSHTTCKLQQVLQYPHQTNLT